MSYYKIGMNFNLDFLNFDKKKKKEVRWDGDGSDSGDGEEEEDQKETGADLLNRINKEKVKFDSGKSTKYYFEFLMR